MATSTVTPTENKIKYNLSVNYVSADGSTKQAVSEREFSVPDKTAKITVNVVADDGKTNKTVERDFERIVVADQDGLLALLNENPYLVISAFNYGADLFARNTIKGPIATEVEGPGKALAKLAEQIMTSRAKLGKPITKERALQMAQLMSEEE